MHTHHSVLTWLMSSKNLKGQRPARFNACKNTTSECCQGWKHNNADATLIPEDYAGKGVFTVKKAMCWQKSSRCELLRQ